MGGRESQKKRRVRRVLELSSAGATIPDISALMKKEGFKASERTVWSDLNSIEAKQYTEEILRKQLSDITIANISLRLKYRGKLLDKLLPSKIEQKVEGEVRTYDVPSLLDELLEKEAEMLEKNR